MKGLLEYKDFTAEIKDVDFKSRTVSGWWASYGNKDHDKDIIHPGAARKTIMERGPQGTNEIFFLNHHNWEKPHARPYLLRDEEKGIYFEATMPLSSDGQMVSYSKDTLILYEAGVVAQHSIGFNTLKSEDTGNYADGTFTRHIKEIKLWEGSNVTLGANSNTPFTGFKSLTLEESNDQIKTIVKLIRNGTLTDETFLQLEFALKQLQKHAYELGKAYTDSKSLIQAEPEASTLIIEEPIVNTEIIDLFKNFKLN